MAINVNGLDFDWQIAICLALDMTQEEAAETLGCTRQTLYNHRTDNPRFFDVAIPFVQALRERYSRAKVSEIVGPAEDRIKKLFDRSFRLTERLIQKAEEREDEATIDELMEIHKNITVWASKFSASEAPKRIKHEGGQNHLHVHVMGLDEAKNLLVTRQMIAEGTPAAIEAEVVTQ